MLHFFQVVEELLVTCNRYTMMSSHYASQDDFAQDASGLCDLVKSMMSLEDQAVGLGLFIWYNMRAAAREANSKLSVLLGRDSETYL